MNMCDLCAKKTCDIAGDDSFPANCPSTLEINDTASDLYTGLDYEFASAANAMLEFAKGTQARVEESMVFAREMGYTKLGVAFCVSMAPEAAIYCQVLRDNGFEVESVVCKNGGHYTGELSAVGHDAETGEVRHDPFVGCNPIVQAQLLNEAKTELNIIFGLCIGHDTLFIRHSEAPVTYLATRDFLTDHWAIEPLREHEGKWERIHHADLPEPRAWENPC